MHTLSNFDFKGRFDTLESQVHSYLKEVAQASTYQSKFNIYRWAIDLSHSEITTYVEMVLWGDDLFFLDSNGNQHLVRHFPFSNLIDIIYELPQNKEHAGS